MNKTQLETQANQIEAVLSQHGVPARVTGGLVAPRWICFLVPKAGKIEHLTEELALALDVDTCRVSRNRGMVAVEIPRADPRPVRLLSMQRRLAARGEIPLGVACLGLTCDGAPLMMRLPSPQVGHLLVAGSPGCGKSSLLRTIVTSLALDHRPSEIGFVLIGRVFGALTGMPHLLRPVFLVPEQAARMLGNLAELMSAREREGWRGDPNVVVVIDELADLTATGKALTRLTQRGREVGVHVIACTREPANRLPQANFPVRLVGQVTSAEEAEAATGYSGTGAEQLRHPGDFIAVNGGQVTRFQAAYVSEEEALACFAPTEKQAAR